MKSLYLINPRADFPTYFSADYFEAAGLAPATQMADLAIPSLAALAADHLQVELCDETIAVVDSDAPHDFVGITGKITQYRGMVKWAEHFRGLGRKVLIGGSLASLSPELLRPHCDVLVRGEIEEIADELFGDLAAGHPKDTYEGGQPDLSLCRVPRWELYPNARALLGTLQTSRGCPFQCEFCDVIQYVGRKQRHKPIALILAEADVLYDQGYRGIFLADDNLTVYRARARDLLKALKAWNDSRPAGRVSFYTQVSIDISDDEEMLRLCAEAGLTTVFIGIETPNPESLKQAGKRQNLKRDLVECVARFMRHGIQVVGGMIVGFDADDASVFERQLQFAQASGIAVFSMGALVAPAATPLHQRLQQAGRLREEGTTAAAVPWSTNIVHPTLGHEELIHGLRWLVNKLYDPKLFGDRLVEFLDRLPPQRGATAADFQQREMREVDLQSFDLARRIRRLGPGEAELWNRAFARVFAHGHGLSLAMSALCQYLQVRHMLDRGHFWEPALVESASPSEALVQLKRRPTARPLPSAKVS